MVTSCKKCKRFMDLNNTGQFCALCAERSVYESGYERHASSVSASEAGSPRKAAPVSQEVVKRKLMERLMKLDSSLIKEALASKNGAEAEVSSSATVQPVVPEGERHTTPRRYIKNKRISTAVAVEMEMIRACDRAKHSDASLKRLRRKLIVRQIKRYQDLGVFDLDERIYRYLQNTGSLRSAEDSSDRVDSPLQAEYSTSLPSQSLVLHNIPFIADPTLSFRAKLMGRSDTLPSFPPPIISPFSGRLLQPYMKRDYTTRPRKLALLVELKNRFGKEGDSRDKDSVDFCFFQKEFLAQVNSLLQQFFWPGIDMSENLEYPEYSIVVLYKFLVIGCAFMAPDGYLLYLFVHPEWSGAGIGSILLEYLIQSINRTRDLTLHVSVTNPAMVMYQKFGFKAEQFNVNFYEKYYQEDVAGVSKNAFFLRLRR